MNINIEEIKKYLDSKILPELDKGRPNWDRFHTIGVVHYIRRLIEKSEHFKIDPFVLIITAYVHDWGYVGLFKDGAILNSTEVSNVKIEHMLRGAQKTKELLKDPFFKFLTVNQKKEIIHIVSIHDTLEEIKTDNERFFLEADTMGGLDTNFCKPEFDEESNNKYMSKVRSKNLPLFLTKYGKEKFDELYTLRSNYYFFRKNQKTKDKSVYNECGEYKGRKYNETLYLGNPGILPKVDQAQAVAFISEGDQINLVFFKHIDGNLGIPGGGVEENEIFIDTLKRESIEEINCEVVDFGIVGYEIIDYPDFNERKYFGRYWTLVKKLNGPVNDPCGKAIKRILVPYEQSVEILNWGKKGKLLLEEAYKNFMERD